MEIQISKKSAIDEHSNVDIPDWLLFEILLRLPPHFVCSYKIVSKQWLSIASDSYFIRTYISRASSSPHPWTVLPPIFHRVSVDANSSGCVMPRNLYHQPRFCKICLPCHKESNVLVIGVRDGLVLYLSLSPTTLEKGTSLYNFYICNPITGQWITIHTARFLLGFSGWGFLTRVDEFGVLKSFRIVWADHFMENPASLLCSVYYSETDEWKEFRVPNPQGGEFFLSQFSAAVLDGILHWTDFRLGVVAYDPERNPERVRVIEPPGDAMDSTALSSCAAYRGKLRYFQGCAKFCDDGLMQFSIWSLDHYHSGEWRLQHKVQTLAIPSEINLPGDFVKLEPLFIDAVDEDVVYLRLTSLRHSQCAEFYVSYCCKTKMVVNRSEMIVRDGPYSFPWSCKPPFMFWFEAPPWPTTVADDHLDRRRRSG